MSESRLHKSYLNARVNVFFYLVTLFISFFSRKIFLEKLGADFVGLTSTMQNLLGFLNLAELGIGASIGYVLYKPIFDGNRDRIKEIVSVLAYLYRNVGLLILGAGLLLACFLPYIFADAGIRLGQGRRVVDAVAYHQDGMPLPAECMFNQREDAGIIVNCENVSHKNLISIKNPFHKGSGTKGTKVRTARKCASDKTSRTAFWSRVHGFHCNIT